MILCDTGVLVAAAVRNDKHYHRCTEMFSAFRLAEERLLVPQTVIAETGYMLESRVGPAVEAAFLRSLGDGDLEPVALEAADFIRASELVSQYADNRLGTTDASVIALSERLGITDIATIDQTHFRVVRPRHVTAFTIHPERLT